MMPDDCVAEQKSCETPKVTEQLAGNARNPEPDAKSILRYRLDYLTANITRRLVDIQRMRDRLEYCSERDAKFLLDGLDSRVFDRSIERL